MSERDRSAATNEIEVTEEMIAAGGDELGASNYGRDPLQFADDVACAILFRALEAGGFSPKRR
jgi:hypothetical protein